MAEKELHVGRSLVRGGAWMTALRWSVRGIGLVNTFILAHLLLPSDFGLIAMAMAVISVVEILASGGQTMALVRHPNPTREHYDSVWTLSILIAIALTLILWIIAEPAALYFHTPKVLWLVRILALGTLVKGFTNVGVVAFRRDLQFNREFQYNLLRRLVSAAITVWFALWLRDWRALAVGILGGHILGVALSYWIHPYRPRLCFSRIVEFLVFSGWMLTVSISEFINGRADEFAVGSLGHPGIMGLYSVASDTATAPTTETVLPVLQALFPVFAKIRNDPAALRAAYLDVLSATCILSVAVAGGMALVAGDFVRVLLGTKWLMAVPLIRMLAIAGGLSVIMQNGIPILIAIGHERRAAQLTVTRGFSMVLAIGAAALTGNVTVIVYARVVVTLVFIPGIFLALARVLPLTMGDMLARLWRPVMAGLVMAACVLTMHHAAPDFPPLRLVMDVATGAVAYSGATLGLWGWAGFPPGLESGIVSWLRAQPILQRVWVWI